MIARKKSYNNQYCDKDSLVLLVNKCIDQSNIAHELILDSKQSNKLAKTILNIRVLIHNMNIINSDNNIEIDLSRVESIILPLDFINKTIEGVDMYSISANLEKLKEELEVMDIKSINSKIRELDYDMPMITPEMNEFILILKRIYKAVNMRILKNLPTESTK